MVKTSGSRYTTRLVGAAHGRDNACMKYMTSNELRSAFLEFFQGHFSHVHPLLQGKSRFFGGVFRNRHNHLIEQVQSALNQVGVSLSNGIKSTRIYSN